MDVEQVVAEMRRHHWSGHVEAVALGKIQAVVEYQHISDAECRQHIRVIFEALQRVRQESER